MSIEVALGRNVIFEGLINGEDFGCLLDKQTGIEDLPITCHVSRRFNKHVY